MNDFFKIAWRNLWRNRRRTLITASSIFFAVFFAIIMRSFQLGTYGHMIEQSIEAYSGYLQIQGADYFDDPCLDNSFDGSSMLLKKLESEQNIKIAVPRIESFALASTGNISKGVIVTGIDPDKEKFLSDPERKLIKLPGFKENYQKFANGDGILISERLSKYLRATIGDSVVLLGQGFQGVSASGVYPVRGIVKIASIDLDNKLIYMTLIEADNLYSLGGRLTSIAINLKNADLMNETASDLTRKLNDKSLSIKTWPELMPVIKQQIDSDNEGGIVMVGVLYLIIFFGIFGTVQMMISERMREFGVMVAIGMKQIKLVGIIFIEMLSLGLIGILSGMMSAVPILLYGFYHPIRITGNMAKTFTDLGFDPIMPFAWFDSYFFIQGVVVLLMVIVASLIPVRKILTINIIRAIKN